MRHRKKFNHLGRTSAHRKAMLSNMATSLLLHKRITTTLAKAKALRPYIEPLISRSKEDSTHSRRMVFRYLQSKEAVTELFREISTKVANRPGGYTRIIKMENRAGDNAEMCLIELVDYNENLLGEKAAPKTAKKRRRRSAGKDKTSPKTEATKPKAVEKIAEEEKSETPEVVEEKLVEVDTKTETPEAVEEKTETPEMVEEKPVEGDTKTETPEAVEEKSETPEVVEEKPVEVDTKTETPEAVEEKTETPEVVEEKPVEVDTKIETPEIVEEKTETPEIVEEKSTEVEAKAETPEAESKENNKEDK